MKGNYLYGIIKKDKNHSLNLGGLTAVTYQSLVAVVVEKEVKNYHKLPKEETIRELVSHQKIIEKIMSQISILPIKFGTILKDKEEVISVLEKGHYFLRNILRRIEDKIELDLVCFWNEAKAAQTAYQQSKKIRDYFTSEVARRDSSDGGIEAKITLGKLVADYLASQKEKISLQILRVLKKEAVESCTHTLTDINMLLNQAFLVEKKRQKAFNDALNQLDSRFADLLNFRLLGPLPPYSFATLVIDSLDKKEVEKAKKTFKLNGALSRKKLKQTYDKLAMRLHPDKGGSPLEFEIVASAYKLLGNFIQNGLISVSLYKWEEH